MKDPYQLWVALLGIIRVMAFLPAMYIAFRMKDWLITAIMVCLWVAIIANSFYDNDVVWAFFGAIASLGFAYWIDKKLRLTQKCKDQEIENEQLQKELHLAKSALQGRTGSSDYRHGDNGRPHYPGQDRRGDKQAPAKPDHDNHSTKS